MPSLLACLQFNLPLTFALSRVLTFDLAYHSPHLTLSPLKPCTTNSEFFFQLQAMSHKLGILLPTFWKNLYETGIDSSSNVGWSSTYKTTWVLEENRGL